MEVRLLNSQSDTTGHERKGDGVSVRRDGGFWVYLSVAPNLTVGWVLPIITLYLETTTFYVYKTPPPSDVVGDRRGQDRDPTEWVYLFVGATLRNPSPRRGQSRSER